MVKMGCYCRAVLYRGAMTNGERRVHLLNLLALGLLAPISAGCGGSESSDDHRVFFTGYVYDGASGARLTKAQLTAVSVKYRSEVIVADIEADGRFVTQKPLPTWQDYLVYIGAAGYRPFVSQNLGIDVPASVAMTNDLVSGKTTQTFQMEATLFPVALKSPKVSLTIDTADMASAEEALPRSAGQIRLVPKSLSVLEPASGSGSSLVRARRWLNDEDLKNQTLIKPFVGGVAEFAEGELVYGVSYEVSIFGVMGYQPRVFPDLLVAGQVASRTLVLVKEQKDPLKIVASNADSCVPPAGNSTEFGAAVTLDFNEAIELVSTNAAEEIDNGVFVAPTGSLAYPQTGSYCGLRTSTNPAMQERGTKVTILANKLTLSFNPSIGLNMTTAPFACMAPPNFTSVTYSNLQNVVIRPVGDSTRKKTMSELLTAFAQQTGGGSSSQIVCGSRASSF